MDPTVGQLILAAIGGIGGAGIAMSGGWDRYTPVEGEGGVRPRPRCWPWCPIFFGAALAVILILVFGETLDPRGDLLTTGVLATIGGLAGATLSLSFQNLGGKQPL